MTMRRRPPATKLLVPVALALVTLALADTCQPKRGPLARPEEELPECPMDDHGSRVTLALPGPISTVPEFHDCQRFIVSRKFLGQRWREYQPLEAIWVRDQLDSVRFPALTGGVIPARADSVGTVVPGGVSYWVGDSSLADSSPATTAVGVAVALVKSDGKGYAPLGIRPGYNCLYLYNPLAWQAIMVPVDNERACFDNREISALSGTPLAVRETRVPGRGNRDYPPVVRWEQGARGYNVGIKCLGAWCEIGPDMGSSAAYTGGRTREVKGWYDEQHLAVHTASGKQWPTTIQGTFFPDEGLYDLSRLGFPHDTWVPVAQVALQPAAGMPPPATDELRAYRTKFNFTAKSVSQPDSIFFCYGSRTGCFPGPAVASAPACNKPGEGQYWAKIVSTESGATAYRCVTYTNHGVTLPGVVRWRWLANDEKGWVSCPSGCCQVNQ